MVTEDSVRGAYVCIRKHNFSIPDEVLDFMYKVAKTSKRSLKNLLRSS